MARHVFPLLDIASSGRLPQVGQQRWVAGKKAQVLTAIQAGVLSLEEACKRYALTPEEVRSWHASFLADGVGGLKMKRLAERRATARRPVKEPGFAVLNDGDREKCTITDIGPRGARLEFRERASVPTQFTLMARVSGRSLPVSVKWQHQQTAGVQFESTATPIGVEDLGSWLLGGGMTTESRD